jgi:hypothetical protein
MTKAKGEEGAGGQTPRPLSALTQFEHFEDFARRVIAVPKRELDEQARLYHELRTRKRRHRPPQP